MSLLITLADLPGADLAADVRLSAGRGWLPLVREALADLEGLKILAIREDTGALVIDTTRGTEAQRVCLAEIRAASASLHVCELVYEGTKDGRPAGWLAPHALCGASRLAHLPAVSAGPVERPAR